MAIKRKIRNSKGKENKISRSETHDLELNWKMALSCLRCVENQCNPNNKEMRIMIGFL
jgi:hypothetical protein